MAWSSAEISAVDLALMAADKPILLGQNRARVGEGRWIANGVWGADQSAAGYPIARAYDDYDHLRTKPNANASLGSGVYRWYVVFDLGAEYDVDSVVILNHNFFTLALDYVTVSIADSSDFTTNYKQLAAYAPIDNSRIVLLDLHHTGANPRLYSGVRYIRIRIYKTASTFLPQLGEIFIGTRRQLKHHPKLPINDYDFGTESVIFKSASGIQTQYVKNYGGRRIDFVYSAYETAYVSALRTFWQTDLVYGTHPFFYIDFPTTTPREAYWMCPTDSNLQQQLVDYIEREFFLRAEEQGPNFYKVTG